MPPVQAFIGSEVAGALAQKFGTQVSIGKVNLGFFNRIIIDDVMMLDQKGDSMICASRVSAKLDFLPLKDGKISVSSAQLFGLNANIYKQDAKSPMNIQFVLDSLASKDTTRHTPLDLHIGSLIIRHGAVAYNQRDIAPKPGVFSPQHLGIRDLSAHIILSHLTDKDIHLTVKKISLKDKSGLQLKNLRFKLDADQQQALLRDFSIELPHSQLQLNDLRATYRIENKHIVKPTLQFQGGIKPSTITLADIACFVPEFSKFKDALQLHLQFSGTSTSARIHDLEFKTQSGSLLLRANGRVSDWDRMLRWKASISALKISGEGIGEVSRNLGKRISIPKEVLRLGDIYYIGEVYGAGKKAGTRGQLKTGVGEVAIKAEKAGDELKASINTQGINLGRILDNRQFGILAASLSAHGNKQHFYAKGSIPRFDFNKYSYRNIQIDGSYKQGLVEGLASIADPNANIQVEGSYSIPRKQYAATAHVQHLLPTILGLKVSDKTYSLDDITVSAKNQGKDSYFDLEAPFASCLLYTSPSPRD